METYGLYFFIWKKNLKNFKPLPDSLKIEPSPLLRLMVFPHLFLVKSQDQVNLSQDDILDLDLVLSIDFIGFFTQKVKKSR